MYNFFHNSNPSNKEIWIVSFEKFIFNNIKIFSLSFLQFNDAMYFAFVFINFVKMFLLSFYHLFFNQFNCDFIGHIL